MKPAMLLPLARSNQSCHLTNIAVVLQVQTEASGPRNCSRVVVTWVEQVPAFRHWRILNQLKLPSSAAFPSFFFFLFCSGCWHLRRQWFNPGTFNTKFCLTDQHSIKLLSCHPFAYKLSFHQRYVLLGYSTEDFKINWLIEKRCFAWRVLHSQRGHIQGHLTSSTR